MGVGIIEGRRGRTTYATLFCDTTEWAFGPVFRGPHAREMAAEFLEYVRENAEKRPRRLSDPELEDMLESFTHDEVST